MPEASTTAATKKRPGLLRHALGAVALLVVVAFLVVRYEPLAWFRPKRTGPEFAAPADRRTAAEHPALGPHGGTLGVIGDEAAHVEILHDTATGTLTLHVLGSDAVTPMPLSQPSLQVTVRFGDEARTLDLKAQGTAGFTGQDPWLRGKSTFIVKLPAIAVAGEAGVEMQLPFPAGNDAAALGVGK